MAGFLVMKEQCDTCIYRKKSKLEGRVLDWNIDKLEDDVRDEHVGFKDHRVCHHNGDACCRGFWNRHKNEFTLGQIAQRLNRIDLSGKESNVE